MNPVVKKTKEELRGITDLPHPIFYLVLIVSSTTNKASALLPLPFGADSFGNRDWSLFTQYRLSPQYGVVFSPGYRALAFPRVGRSGYYGYFKTLANYCLSHISGDFYLDPEFGWLGPSSLVQPSLGGLFGCWGSPWAYGLGCLCLSFGAVQLSKACV